MNPLNGFNDMTIVEKPNGKIRINLNKATKRHHHHLLKSYLGCPIGKFLENQMLPEDIGKFQLKLIVQNCSRVILLLDNIVLNEYHTDYKVPQKFFKGKSRKLFVV